MPKFVLWFDLTCAVFVFVAASTGIILWLRQTSRKKTITSAESIKRAIFCIGTIVGGCFALAYLCKVAFYVPIVVFLLMILAAMTGEIFGILGMPAVAIAYFIREYILGFPETVLAPESTNETKSQGVHELQKHMGQYGTVTSALKPLGEIELAGERMPAASNTGSFIQAELMIVVVGNRNGTLLVKEDPSADQSKK